VFPADLLAILALIADLLPLLSVTGHDALKWIDILNEFALFKFSRVAGMAWAGATDQRSVAVTIDNSRTVLRKASAS
jgi:hypothetical protein